MGRSKACSERDVVVERVGFTARCTASAATHGTPAHAAHIVVRRPAGPATAAAAIEHGELAAELPQHDLGRVFLLTRLVGVFASFELALDVNLGALFQVLLGHV